MTAKSKNWLAFLYGLGSMTQVRIVGSMGITELVCVFISPFVLSRTWRTMRRTRVKPMLMFMAAWFLSALLTDLVWRQSRLYDMLRGCTAIVFLAVMLICTYALIHDDLMRLRWIAVGTFLSGVLAIFVFQPQVLYGLAEKLGAGDVAEVMEFKTYYVHVWNAFAQAAAAVFYSRAPALVVALQCAVGALHLREGSRSAFLVALVAALGSYVGRYAFPALRAVQRNMVAFVIAAVLCAFGVEALYGHAAASGWMGEQERRKYEAQSETKIGLLSGRAEFIGALAAIRDSPLLGHGSWALDDRMYRRKILEWLEDEKGLERYERDARLGLHLRTVPTHSHIWQAWVWHGLAGGVFWIAILAWMFRYLVQGIHLCRPLLAYNLMITVSSFWSILFSPFYNRPRWGTLLATIAVTLAEVDRRRQERRRGTGVPPDAPWDGKPVRPGM
jgi:hypothetical protein